MLLLCCSPLLPLLFLAQGTILPKSLALQGLLSVTACQMTASSSLAVDEEDVSLELRQSCTTPHFSGTLSHSLSVLKNRGLPQIISVEASDPEGSDHAGAVVVKIGTCRVRARRTTRDRVIEHWLWGLETDCPLLQVCLCSTLCPVGYLFSRYPEFVDV